VVLHHTDRNHDALELRAIRSKLLNAHERNAVLSAQLLKAKSDGATSRSFATQAQERCGRRSAELATARKHLEEERTRRKAVEVVLLTGTVRHSGGGNAPTQQHDARPASNGTLPSTCPAAASNVVTINNLLEQLNAAVDGVYLGGSAQPHPHHGAATTPPPAETAPIGLAPAAPTPHPGISLPTNPFRAILPRESLQTCTRLQALSARHPAFSEIVKVLKAPIATQTSALKQRNRPFHRHGSR
jgi:hypothetical protein